MMKSYVFIFLTFLCLFSCEQSHHQLHNINVSELDSLLQKDIIILDVRTPQEVAEGQIENSSSINYYDADFNEKIQKIQKDKTVLVYCKSGGRSVKAARILSDLGQHKVYNLSGGIMAWIKAGNSITEPKNNFPKVNGITKEAFSSVLFENDLVLANFSTQWCVPCRKLNQVLDKISPNFDGIIIKIDLDQSKELSDFHEITSVPTLVLFKNNFEVKRSIGFKSETEIEELFLSFD